MGYASDTLPSYIKLRNCSYSIMLNYTDSPSNPQIHLPRPGTTISSSGSSPKSSPPWCRVHKWGDRPPFSAMVACRLLMYSISLNKPRQGYGAWSTRKTVLGWYLDKISHLLCLPPIRQEKVAATLAAIPRKTRNTSLCKWHKILGLLHSITPTVSRSRGMFARYNMP